MLTRERRNFFTERIVDIWNGLPSDIVEANLVNSFKNKLDKCFGLQGRGKRGKTTKVTKLVDF